MGLRRPMGGSAKPPLASTNDRTPARIPRFCLEVGFIYSSEDDLYRFSAAC